MTERLLFEMGECEAESRPEAGTATNLAVGTPRLRVACRDQVVMRMLALDQMLPAADVGAMSGRGSSAGRGVA